MPVVFELFRGGRFEQMSVRRQRARSLGAYTLVGCTVSPAFVFDGFELAPAGWAP